LAVRDEIALSSATLVKVKSLFRDGGVALEVIDGPDAGRSLIIFNCELALAGSRDGSLWETKVQLTGISITWQKERYVLVIEAAAEKSKLSLCNSKFTDNFELAPGSNLVLCDGDQLCNAPGNALLVAKFT